MYTISLKEKCIFHPQKKNDRLLLPHSSQAFPFFLFGKHRWMYMLHHILLHLPRLPASLLFRLFPVKTISCLLSARKKRLTNICLSAILSHEQTFVNLFFPNKKTIIFRLQQKGFLPVYVSDIRVPNLQEAPHFENPR